MPGGRPRTTVGTFGKITVTGTSPPYQASTYFMDADGVLRRVRRFAATRGKAERALREALADRQRASGANINADMKVSDLADEWLRRVETSDKAVGTKQQYRRTIEANVKPAIGALRVSEARVAQIDRALTTIRDRHGYSVAKQARAVMSGMFGLAVRQEAISDNPVRNVERLARTKQVKKPRALTVAEVETLTDALRTLPRAITLDLPDLVDWMLFTGCRVGEALAARDGYNADGEPLLDLEAGTWEINATVVRIRGTGLVIQERPKSKSGWRRVALPASAVQLAQRRLVEGRLRPYEVRLLDAAGNVRIGSPRILFPSPSARTLRDRDNATGAIGEVMTAAGWDWVTSHVFRKTVATRMDEGGCTPRQVADQLGHSKVSMTQDVYFGREVVASDAARILDR